MAEPSMTAPPRSSERRVTLSKADITILLTMRAPGASNRFLKNVGVGMPEVKNSLLQLAKGGNRYLHETFRRAGGEPG
jgi:hypothetical protein